MITVKLDAKDFIRGLEKITKSLPSDLAAGLNKTGRTARTGFLKEASKEIGVSTRKLGARYDHTLAQPSRLQFLYRPMKQSAGPLIEAGIRVNWSRPSTSLTASTHGGKTFGAGSHKSDGFVSVVKGKRIAMLRNIFGKGSHGKGYHAIKVTTPAHLLADPKGKNPQFKRSWEKRVMLDLPRDATEALNRAITKAGF